MELCFLMIFSFLSKRRTNGLAIIEIIHPMTKGIKNTNSFGKIKQRHTMANNATNKFTKIFKYFVDCFMLLLLVPAIHYILLLFLICSCHSLHLVTIPYTFLPFLTYCYYSLHVSTIPCALPHKTPPVPLPWHHKLPAVFPGLTADESEPVPAQRDVLTLLSYPPPESDGTQTGSLPAL